MEQLNYSAEYFHKIVWDRFVRMPYGHVLDYAGKNGEAYYPTAEECERSVPNPRSWGLPIENGAFFTGLYAYALLWAYRKAPSSEMGERIHTLMRGLFLLQDVGKVKGFIARGVGDDGVSHYPMGAECQIFPWLLALYSFYRSELCRDKEAVKKRLLEVLLSLKDYGWKMPCDEEGVFYASSWESSSRWRPVVILLFSARLIAELTGDEKDFEYYEALLSAKPARSVFSRIEIVSQGFTQDMITSFGNQMWICLYAHLGVSELISLDPSRESFYMRGLYNNGVAALASIDSIKGYDNRKDGFDIDWRSLNTLWEDYEKDTKKGTKIAEAQFAYWHEHIVPHRYMEHVVLGNALFAAWVAVTCKDERIESEALRRLSESFDKIAWDELHLSYAFVMESVLIFGENVASE